MGTNPQVHAANRLPPNGGRRASRSAKGPGRCSRPSVLCIPADEPVRPGC